VTGSPLGGRGTNLATVCTARANPTRMLNVAPNRWKMAAANAPEPVMSPGRKPHAPCL
jgi:hypothetical protein